MKNKFKLIFVIFFVCTGLFSQQIQFGNEEPSNNITDGPYILWENNKAIIKYILDNNPVSQEVTVQGEGTFSFSLEGFNKDFEISSIPPTIHPSTFSDVSKIFVISDIHGQYDRFVQILKGSRVIDASLDWSWGNGHLVILGDVFDRGSKVTECLWLIHKLENQAERWQGKVHYLLGNHEVMFLRGNLKYVHDKYKKAAELFKMELPQLYSTNSEFGRWLRSKHTIVKINNILFVHGGIHPRVAYWGYNLQDINDKIRRHIDSSDDTIKYSEYLSFLFGSDGPLWYRGYFSDTKTSLQIKQDDMIELAAHLYVSEIVVGHTTQDFINPFFKDKVIPIDTGIKYGDKGEALIWENEIFYRAKANGYREQIIFK